MKKAIKIILIIITSLVVLTIITLKLTPGIAKNYLIKHSEEFIGRKIDIQNASLNLHNFVVELDTFALMEQDGKTPFVAFEKFRINLDPLKIITRTACVSEIYMKGFYTHITQNGDKFNFSDIIDFLATKDTTTIQQKNTSTDSTSSINIAQIANKLPFNIEIQNITFEKGNIIYEDKKVSSKIQLDDFSLKIPAIYLSDKATGVGVNFKFVDGGNLDINVNANMATNDFDIKVALNNFALACGKPYLNDFINYNDFSGFLSTDIAIKGNLNNVISSNVEGDITINNISLTETSGKSIGVKSINIGISEINIPKNKFHLDSVIVDGAYAHFDIHKDGKTNIDILLKQSKKSPEITDTTDTTKQLNVNVTKEEKHPQKLDAIINKLLIKNTSIEANDQSIKKPFNYTVNAINVSGFNVNFNTPCTINVSANFPEGGNMSLKYKGAINDISTMDAYISMKNIALKHFSNYSLHYTGYPITAGTMAFASDNKMNKYDIESKNTIDIYNINVGDKDKNIDPEFTVPMKVGLYILKDKDEKIQFDIPVKGNMNDPEFSIFKIVWKTIMNLLVKVAVSPLKLVGNIATTGANAIGIDLGNNDEIIINPFTPTFESEQFAKAINMTKIIENDPNLKIILTQYYNPQKVLKDYKLIKLKTDFYKIKENKTVLNELDHRAILEINDNDESFSIYANEYLEKLEDKTLLQDIALFAEKRNQEMQKIILQQNGITSKNFKILTAPKGQLNGYRGKPMYKVTIDVQ